MIAPPGTRAAPGWRLPAVWLLAGVVAVHASAASAAAQAVGDRKWEVEVSGGGEFSIRPVDGAALPIEPGEPFTTVAGEPSRRVRSWFFGDGAALLNEAVEGFRDQIDVPPIDPLDEVLGTGLLGPHATGGVTSLRVTRVLNRRFAVEFSGSYSTYPRVGLVDTASAGIRQSRESFEPTWAPLMLVGPFDRSTVGSATATWREGRLREAAVTGVLQVTFPTAGREAPYVSVGAGYVDVSGVLPSSEVVGTYRFRVHREHLFEQVDAVTLRSSSSGGAVVGVLGGGVKAYLSDRWGLRLDVRALIGPSTTYLEVDTDPRVHADDGFDAVASRTAPSIQFGNEAAGVPSTLGLPAQGLRTWSASGLLVRARVSLGVFWRF